MLLGLLFLLFCLMVGAVVLTAASANAGRTERNRQVQQNYLAVQSAANLIMDDMADMDFQGVFVHRHYTRYDTWTDSSGSSHVEITRWIERDRQAELAGTAFGDLLEDYCQKLFLSAPALDAYREKPEVPPATLSAVLTLAGPEGGDEYGLPAVEVTLSIGAPGGGAGAAYSDEGYTVTVTLALAEPAPEGDHAMTLVFHPVVATVEDSAFTPGNPEIDTTTITTSVAWERAVVTKGEPS